VVVLDCIHPVPFALLKICTFASFEKQPVNTTAAYQAQMPFESRNSSGTSAFLRPAMAK